MIQKFDSSKVDELSADINDTSSRRIAEYGNNAGHLRAECDKVRLTLASGLILLTETLRRNSRLFAEKPGKV
jgi:hypothetical protein